MDIEHAWALGEAKRLKEENERLRKDADRLDFLANKWGSLYSSVGSAGTLRLTQGSEWTVISAEQVRDGIDAARGAK